MKKILSVSIAAYNVGKYLPKLFDVLNVSDYLRDNIELIVVNDGSKDNTLDVANSYKEKYPNSIVIIDKENGGYGSTINASIKIATGKYYKILDGDDFFNVDNIEDFLKYLDTVNDDLVISPYIDFYKEDNTYEIIDRHSNGNLNEKSFIMHEIAIKTELYKNKREEIIEHCFYTDTEFVLNAMIISNSTTRYPKPVYCYRLGRVGQSVSVEGLIKHIDDANTEITRCLDLYSKHLDKKSKNINYFFADKLGWYYQTIVAVYGNEGIDKVIEFDKKVKNKYQAIYDISSMSKKIKLIRLLRYKPKILIKSVFCNKGN